MDNNLESRIKNLVAVIGTEHPVFQSTVYATSWVSRIPKLNNLSSPAFPETLTWLKSQQLKDGGFGSDNPTNPFANTISTLSAILALKQWQDSNDQEIISKAYQALSVYAQKISDKGQKTFGFELILAALIEEFKTKKYLLPNGILDIYQRFIDVGNTQRDMLKAFLKQTNYQQPNLFWVCLEMLGGVFLADEEQPWLVNKNALAQNGSVFASVTSTAYFLAAHHWRRHEVPHAFTYLSQLVKSDNGGIPPYHPMEQYELVFALDFLLKGKVPIDLLTPAIKRLHQHWKKHQGLGYSIYSPSLDADDSALAINVLRKAGINVDCRSLLEFFNGEYFSHYKEDPTPSVSVNANALRALQHFQDQPEIKAISNKIIDWLKTKAFVGNIEEALHDTWHMSPYYAACAVVFGLSNLNSEITTNCVKWLVSKQNADGGWGSNHSTLEETALVILALKHVNKEIKNPQKIFEKAKDFLTSDNKSLNRNCLYMGITTVCPIYVVEATIVAAHHAL